MRPLLSALICVAVIQLSVGDEPVEEVTVKQQVNYLGSWTERNLESQEVLDAVKFAVKTFNSHSKHKRVVKLLSVTSAKSQTTREIKYKIELILAKTKCLKSENHDENSCNLAKKHLKCNFSVTFEPFSNRYELIDAMCHKSAAHNDAQ